MHLSLGSRSILDVTDATPDTFPCVCTALRKSGRVISRVYDEALAPSGLRVTQYALLSTLSREGPLPVTALAEALVLDRTTLSRNLIPLEREGLVAVEPGEDRRTHRVQLTPEGEIRLDDARPAWLQAQQRIAAAFGTERLGALLQEVRAITRAVR
jgi:DNA-binding MarR family transcriptional regulator